MEISIEMIAARWSDPSARPLLKGQLIDDDGHCCAQGDVLRLCGWSDDKLRLTDEREADLATAEALGISIAHAVLLRNVDDEQDGCPEDVLIHPEKVLGDQAQRLLEFWRRLDSINWTDWAAAWDAAMAAAGAAAGAPAWDSAWDAAGARVWTRVWAEAEAAAWNAAGAAAGSAARDAAGGASMDAPSCLAAAGVAAAAGASHEIQGERMLNKLFFLPLFGINSVNELDLPKSS